MGLDALDVRCRHRHCRLDAGPWRAHGNGEEYALGPQAERSRRCGFTRIWSLDRVEPFLFDPRLACFVTRKVRRKVFP